MNGTWLIRILTKTGTPCWWSDILALRKRETKIQLENPLPFTFPIKFTKFVFVLLTQRTWAERQYRQRIEEWFINEKPSVSGFSFRQCAILHVHGAYKWYLAGDDEKYANRRTKTFPRMQNSLSCAFWIGRPLIIILLNSCFACQTNPNYEFNPHTCNTGSWMEILIADRCAENMCEILRGMSTAYRKTSIKFCTHFFLLAVQCSFACHMWIMSKVVAKRRELNWK